MQVANGDEADASAAAGHERDLSNLKRLAYSRPTGPEDAARSLEARRLLAEAEQRVVAATEQPRGAEPVAASPSTSAPTLLLDGLPSADDDVKNAPPSGRWRIVAAVAAVAVVALAIALIAGPGVAFVASLGAAPTPTSTSTLPPPDPDFMHAVVAELGSPPKPDSLSRAEEAAAIAVNNDSEWEMVVNMYPSAVRPEVEPIRTVDYDDYMDVRVDCLVSRGVDATRTTDGYRSSTSTEAEAVSAYTCAVEYPVSLPAPLNEKQIGYIYDYQVQFAVPCLEGLGHEQEEPPSRDEYIETWGEMNTWFPVANGTRLNRSMQEAVAAACPSSPEGMY